MDTFHDLNLYDLLGVPRTATAQEVKKAYRKKALSCHPDKHPDNPRAVELFHQLSRALEILTDTSARAAYDKVIIAKEQARLRVKEFDSKRRKLKEDLEAREEAYNRSSGSRFASTNNEAKLQAEIERLRKEGSRQVEEEIAYVERKIRDRFRENHDNNLRDGSSYKIKIKWKSEKDSNRRGYDYNTLHQIFSKYGDIVALVVSSTKEGRALVEFQNKTDAETAASTEMGFVQNPLSLQKLWDTKARAGSSLKETNYVEHRNERISFTIKDPKMQQADLRQNGGTSTNFEGKRKEMSDEEFERSVLLNLKKAEEFKRSSTRANSGEGT